MLYVYGASPPEPVKVIVPLFHEAGVDTAATDKADGSTTVVV